MITNTNKIFYWLRGWLFILLLLVTTSYSAKATHLVGGELSLQHVSGDEYELSLYVFFDNINGNAGADDPSVTVSIFRESDNFRMQDILLPRLTSVNLPFQNPECTIQSMSTRRIIYRTNIILQSGFYTSPDGYYIVWDRCCRNNSINNISLPGLTGLVVRLDFPRIDANGPAPKNSSPVIGIPNESYACAGRLFTANLSAYDVDGDSLVYSLTAPLKGISNQNNPAANPPSPQPYSTLFWLQGYSAQQFTIGTQPPAINPQTGILTLNSFFTGIYVYAIKIDEYRNGVHIGSVQRDFQLTVQNCIPVTPPHVNIKDDNGQNVPVADTIVLDLKVSQCLDFKLIDSTSGEGWTTYLESAHPDLPFSQPVIQSNEPLVGNEVKAYRICADPCSIDDEDIWSFEIVAREVNCPDAVETRRKIVVRVLGNENTRPFIYTDHNNTGISPLNYGETVSFNIFGEDSVDAADMLTLSVQGESFDIASLGMYFTSTPNRGKVSGRFRWAISCQSPPPAGEYRLIFTVQDNSCEGNSRDTTYITLIVKEAEEPEPFLIPNVVTANGDGLNEYLMLPNMQVGACERDFGGIKIYNRWGKQVFESFDPSARWSGEGLPTGHYYYQAVYGGATYKGFVSLMR